AWRRYACRSAVIALNDDGAGVVLEPGFVCRAARTDLDVQNIAVNDIRGAADLAITAALAARTDIVEIGGRSAISTRPHGFDGGAGRVPIGRDRPACAGGEENRGHDLTTFRINVTRVTAEAESTLKRSVCPAEIEVVQPVSVASCDLAALESVGLAEAVIES